jgi:hypothetical protein
VEAMGCEVRRRGANLDREGVVVFGHRHQKLELGLKPRVERGKATSAERIAQGGN